jgi:hypothetical protein
VPYWLRKVVGVQLRQAEADWQALQYFIVTLHSRQVNSNLEEGYREKPSTHLLQFTSSSDIRSQVEQPLERSKQDSQVFLLGFSQ